MLTATSAPSDIPFSGDRPPEEGGPAAFARDGYFVSRAIYTPAQCDLILRHLRRGIRPAPATWEKGTAATDRFIYDVATQSCILASLRPLLGDDIVLWGAGILERAPGQVHPWHSDIETSGPEQRTVSLWVGLTNTCRESSLQLITRSHLFGRTIQQAAKERGLRRGEATDEDILRWSREQDSEAELLQLPMNDGDALVFDGRLWHGSSNRSGGRRVALLLQYAAADCPIRMPDFSQLEWPFRFKEESVPALLISGTADSAENHIVTAPESKMLPAVKSLVGPIEVPGHENAEVGWQPNHLFFGRTANLRRIAAHFSVLSAGRSPHPPHAHIEEELLIMLDGDAELMICDNADAEPSIHRLRPGSFVYYPAYQYHTLRNATDSPITYLMFKWVNSPRREDAPLTTSLPDIAGLPAPANIPFAANLVLEGATSYLSKLHVHRSVLAPGAGYPAHADSHDVAIILRSGHIESCGKRIDECGGAFFPAGDRHDMRNVGANPAEYLAFEFHGPAA